MKKFFGMALAIAIFFLAGCSDSNSPSTVQHAHFEADGWILYWPDWTPAYSVFQGKADSSLAILKVNANCLSERLGIRFLDSDKKEIAGPEDGEHSFGWSIADSSILDIEQCGNWGFHLKGLKEGETTLVLKVNHHDHADARTPEIRVVVDKFLMAEDCPFQDDDD